MVAERGTLQPGERFHARYRVVRVLRVGGMGTIYEVIDERTNTPRALKLMLPNVGEDADQRARFEREARITGDIDSDHLVRVLDAGHDGGAPFLVMELLRGEDLQSVLKRQRRLPPAECLEVLTQVARTLEKTHARKIVHRDLKPDNLFLTRREDGSPCVKILDFGIAKVVQEGEAHRTKALGTPLFMAPEQARGRASLGPPADLYALAHVAYAVLVGEPYFAVESSREENVVALMMVILEGAKEAPTARAYARSGGAVALPPAFDAWFMRATSRDPASRHASAVEEIEELRGLLRGGAPASHVVSAEAPTAQAPTAPAAQPSAARAPLTHSPMAHSPAAWTQTAPAHASPPSGGPSQQPLAPASSPTVASAHVRTLASAPAPRSNAGIVLVAGGLLALAALGGGALLWSSRASAPTRSASDATDDDDDDDERPAPKRKPTASAPATCDAAACAKIDVPDKARADVMTLVARSHGLAREVDAGARWVSLYVVGMSGQGTVDTGVYGAFTATYATESTSIAVTANPKGLVANKVANLAAAAATVPDPGCSLSAALAKGGGVGFTPTSSSTALYAISVYTQKPTWQLSADRQLVYLDGNDCTVLQSSGW